MRNTILLLLLVVMQHNNADAQADITSLQKQVSNIKEDTTRIRLLNTLAEAFYRKGENDSCGKYAHIANRFADDLLQKEAVKNNTAYSSICKRLKVQALQNISNKLLYENTPASLDTMLVALRLSTERGDKKYIADCYSALATIYNVQKDYVNGVKYYQSALLLYQQLSDKANIGLSFYNIGLSQRYADNYGDALENNLNAIQVGKEINDKKLVTLSLLSNGFIYLLVKNFPEALKAQQEALKVFIELNDSAGIATVYNDMGVLYNSWGKQEEALKNHTTALEIRRHLGNYTDIANSNSYISDILVKKGDYSLALNNAIEALKYTKLGNSRLNIMSMYSSLGNIYGKLGDNKNALKYYDTVLQISRIANSHLSEAKASRNIATIFFEKGETDAAINWLQKAAAIAPIDAYKDLRWIYGDLFKAYAKKNDYKNAYEAHIKYTRYNDSAAAKEKALKINTLTTQLEFENQQALRKASQDKKMAIQQSEIWKQKLVRNISIGGLLAVIVLAAVFFRRFKEKKKMNIVLEKTLHELKATQSQLVHSEKMASLGELTAGIAHEIQNPLNFVNNFSDVNKELLVEMKAEIDKGNLADAKEIANDVIANEEKINHHGKRADAIVKGMLQHSRSSSGKKEPTDINALADEYLRLAYHGLRAKDKSFNATMKTDYDESIGNINIIPQDIGRVILNLITNAFYAAPLPPEGGFPDPDYKHSPTVWVSTKKTGNKVFISVRDNGPGIPKKILDKIFQPFFTTKPTGQGTGLGLSLSYDIVKAHGGELRVETKEGEGSTFIIQLQT